MHKGSAREGLPAVKKRRKLALDAVERNPNLRWIEGHRGWPACLCLHNRFGDLSGLAPAVSPSTGSRACCYFILGSPAQPIDGRSTARQAVRSMRWPRCVRLARWGGLQAAARSGARPPPPAPPHPAGTARLPSLHTRPRQQQQQQWRLISRQQHQQQRGRGCSGRGGGGGGRGRGRGTGKTSVAVAEALAGAAPSVT